MKKGGVAMELFFAIAGNILKWVSLAILFFTGACILYMMVTLTLNMILFMAIWGLGEMIGFKKVERILDIQFRCLSKMLDPILSFVPD
jgi:hypothetical protein